MSKQLSACCGAEIHPKDLLGYCTKCNFPQCEVRFSHDWTYCSTGVMPESRMFHPLDISYKWGDRGCFTGVAHYYNNEWYYYLGRHPIEIYAWREPQPAPYIGEKK